MTTRADPGTLLIAELLETSNVLAQDVRRLKPFGLGVPKESLVFVPGEA
jgi:hypothetical protein